MNRVKTELVGTFEHDTTDLIGRTLANYCRVIGEITKVEDYSGHRYITVEGHPLPFCYGENKVFELVVEEPAVERPESPVEALLRGMEERGTMLCKAERQRLITAFEEGVKLGHKEGYTTGLREGTNGVVLG